MSNIIQTINFLKGNVADRFLIITNANNVKLGLDKIRLADIPNEDLKAYIKFNLGPQNAATMVWIEGRENRGVTSKKLFTCAIEVLPDTQTAPTPAATTPVVHTAQPTNNAFEFLGNPGNGNGMVGLSIPQIIDMQRKSDRLDDLKEQLDETKSDLKEVRHEKNKLEIELREAASKLAIAEAEKNMAVLMVKAETKGFFDGPGFDKMMDKAPQIFEQIVAMKTGGGAAPEPGMLGNPNISEPMSQFFAWVAENCSDTEVNALGSVCHFLSNPNFMTELKQLTSKYNA